MKARSTRTIFAFSLFLHFSFFILHFSFVKAQVPTVQDCMGAIPVCQEIYVEENSYSGDGNYNNEIFNPSGDCTTDCPGSCLDGEQNSVWYIFTVKAGGLLRVTIDPFGSGDDYDWAVYDLTDLRCSDIYSQYALMQKSCNAYGQAPNGNTGISTPNGGSANCNHCGGSGTSLWNKDLPVVEGRTYVLVVENWSGTTEGYTLDFSASTAQIFDDVRPELENVLANEITCGTTEIICDFSENVMCESVDPTDFSLTGPGGPYTVLDAQGEVCLAGGEMEKRYTLIIDRPINSDGEYALELNPLNFVYDACNNFALGNTVLFTVSLGAPVINEWTLVIDAATCGLSNGSITGITITGTPPYTYIWTDESGNTVGTTLDLLNVPSGNYTLRVSDPHTCLTAGGPYFVDMTGAPNVNDDAIVITGANYGANNGHITGLAFAGNEPFTFLWTDEMNDSVGNGPELHNIYSGNYYLLVTDTYGCDTLAGPYIVQQIGGPISVQAFANPDEICLGEFTQLNAVGSGGAGNYTFSWTSNPSGFASNVQSPVVYPEVTTIYLVTISDGYNVTSASVTVTVNPNPVANAGADQYIPYGTSTTLHGTVSGGLGMYNYFWEPADSLITPSQPNTATKNLYYTTVFTFKGIDFNTGCISSYDTVVVLLTGGPLGVTPQLQDSAICVGDSTTITAYGSGGSGEYDFTWLYGANVLQHDQGYVSNLKVSPAVEGFYTYKVVVDDGYNEVFSYVSLQVNPSPAFQILHAPLILACPLDTVFLETDITYPGASYYWSNGSTDASIPVVTTGLGYNERNFSLTVTNQSGCLQSDSVKVIFDFTACSGIDESEMESLVKVYPNPAENMITFEIDEANDVSALELINTMGLSVMYIPVKKDASGKFKLDVDVSSYSRGAYLLKVVNRHDVHHQLVILN